MKIANGISMDGLSARTPRKSGVGAMLLAGTFAFAGLSGCGDEPEEEPTVAILTPANGSTATGPNVLVKVKTTHFKFASAAAAKTSASSAAQHDDEDAAGHVHVFLDKPAGLDADAIVTMSKSDTATITVAAPGTHYLIVQGADAGHADIDGMIDSVKFTVAIP